MKRSPALPLSLLCALALAACGGSDGAPAAEPQAAEAPAAAASTPARPIASVDPCTLVTRDQVTRAFGDIKEGPTAGTGLRGERQCEYTNMEGSWLKFSVYGGGTDRWESDRAMANAQSSRALSSLGDEAFAIKRGTDAVVYARKGESILEVSCSCPAETAESMARTAAEKL